MRNSPMWWVIIIIMVLVDVYVYFALRSLFNDSSSKTRTVYTIVYASFSVTALVLLFVLPYLQFQHQNTLFRSTIFALVFALFFAKLVAALFFMVDDIRRGVQWVAGKLFSSTNEIGEISTGEGDGISRSVFLTWLGMIAGGGMFSTFVYGLGNKYNYKIKKLQLSFANLPAAFKGLKIVQISDIHSGSFTNKTAVSKGVDMILAQQADVILFTGDLVNNKATEMQNYKDVFQKLKAPMGVYSVLGNHDYGDYSQWESANAKQANLETLKSIHGQMGWRLLLDEHLPLQKGDAQIGLIGVQNISGKRNFHSYGNLPKAMQGAEAYPFKILMSHDPSHWDSEVNTRFKDIDLMLSGHTHGMQFGVELPGFKWSPVKYVYKQWAGLYEKAHQKLYVNRGFGFIGYPGRVGILPEITVITLV
ncbi:MAG: metallophosphoesterase [Niabella sp.]